MTLSIKQGIAISVLAVAVLFAFAPKAHAQFNLFTNQMITRSASVCNTTLGGLFSGLFGCSAQQTENSGESGNTGSSATSISPAGGNVHWSYRTGVDLCPIDSPGVYTCSGAGLT